jgi:hypothetical protein
MSVMGIFNCKEDFDYYIDIGNNGCHLCRYRHIHLVFYPTISGITMGWKDNCSTGGGCNNKNQRREDLKGLWNCIRIEEEPIVNNIML